MSTTTHTTPGTGGDAAARRDADEAARYEEEKANRRSSAWKGSNK